MLFFCLLLFFKRTNFFCFLYIHTHTHITHIIHTHTHTHTKASFHLIPLDSKARVLKVDSNNPADWKIAGVCVCVCMYVCVCVCV